jgi:hypothetical protein
MRFMMMIRANQQTEAGILPSPEIVAAMGRFNEEMMKAGVLLAADGLHPSSKGALVRFSGGKHTILDGPFAEAKELIAGFWMIQVKNKDEAIAWAARCPGGRKEVDHLGGEFEIELRQVFDLSDFPAEVQEAAVKNQPNVIACMQQRQGS